MANNQKESIADALALHREGKAAEADRLLAELQKRAPKNPEILFWRGLIAQERDEPKAAVPLFKRALSLLPKQPEIHQQLALAYQQNGQGEAAERHLKKALTLRPGDSDSLVHLGNLYSSRGEAARGADCYRAALKQTPGDLGALLNLGNSLREMDRPAEAEESYKQAIAHHPNYSGCQDALGALYQSQSRFQEASDCFEAALALDPRDAAAHFGAAKAARDMGQLERAVAHFEQAIAIAPGAVLYAGLAATLERAHRLEAALEAAGKALEMHPLQAEARLVRAKVAQRQDDPARARTLYQEVIADAEVGRSYTAPAILARARADLAQIEESSGDYRQAFALFAAANATNCDAQPHWRAQAEAYIARVEALSGLIEANPLPAAAMAGETAAEEMPAPVFLIGFPRSGTTLLDRLLDAHSEIAVMEEKTLLDQLAARLGDSDAARMAALDQLGPGERAALREAYWALAAEAGPAVPAGGLLVDKLPLNILNIWLIHGIFPEAKIVFGLRDPRDVCLSCFTNLFRLVEATAGFPTLEHSARLYAAVMTFWQSARQAWDLPVHEVRYEDLVEDLEGEARRLCAFLERPWEETLLDYRAKAKERSIVTPSYHQVVRPLYGSSRQRWRHYEAEMAAVLPLLQPFVEAFGYGERAGSVTR